jgi:hypothetical protein
MTAIVRTPSDKPARVASELEIPRAHAAMLVAEVDNRARWARFSREIEAMIDNAEEDGDWPTARPAHIARPATSGIADRIASIERGRR